MTIAPLALLVAIQQLPAAEPASVGMDAARLSRIDDALSAAIAARSIPGAVAIVGRRGKVVHVAALGRRALTPSVEPMTRGTVFDLASLTKPVATAASIMILVDRGRVGLGDALRAHLPEFDNGGKGALTIEQLLRHRSGLVADNPIEDYADGPEAAWSRLAKLPVAGRPGEAFLYSDVNYEILGRVVERASGVPLDDFVAENITRPLGMGSARFSRSNAPPDPSTIAPTEPAGGRMLRGVVHDPRARALGGVAGHAGLFGSADDLAIFAEMILGGGVGANGARVLSPMAVRRMTSGGDTPPGERRGLGWDIQTGQSAPRGSLFGPSSFGHTGFTGTSLWIDPETRAFVVLLTSRLHPDGSGASPTALRREVASIAASAILDPPWAPQADGSARPVLCGVDVLADRGFDLLRGRRVGLVTNHTGRTRSGRSTIDALREAPGVSLTALFSPEHGIRGRVDAEVAGSKDEATGLPIVSLYDKGRRSPPPGSLDGVDILVYDIQDVGARFYTYISTLGIMLEAARARGIPIVVLDRPNPIGGLAVSGPVRDAEFDSFIAWHALPVRHGMTVGELARLFNAERSIGADLAVVPCEGWRRGDVFDRTGLLWTDPSPNMRSPTEALLYPGVGLLEGTNLATGRGTDTPFERVGAPWIDPVAWSAALNAGGLAGVRFTPIRFSPRERQYKGEDCGGVFIAVTDPARFDPIDLAVVMAQTLRRDYRDEWKPQGIPATPAEAGTPGGLLKFLGDRAAYGAIVDELRPLDEVRRGWEVELDEFRKVRDKYLLYR